MIINSKINTLASDIIENPMYNVSFDDAAMLIALKTDDIPDLLLGAYKITQKYLQNRFYTCSILNAKCGLCAENCAFCAQSAHMKVGIKPYPLLSEDELIQKAYEAYNFGSDKFSFVTSGTSVSQKELDIICIAAQKILKNTTLKLCCSLGMLTQKFATQLFQSGFSRYHHNLETSRSYFDQICTTHSYDKDIETIKLASDSGMEVCCGFILGMGESWEQRIEMAFTVKELNVHSIPINFLHPIKGTKMENRPVMNQLDAVKAIALFRYINPTKDITICGGREKTLKDYQSWITLAGANGLMVGNYLTTKGRIVNDDMEMFSVWKQLA